ncbi:unnamed protein product [Prorocentrum cordatum]|uniref:Uncharacterized protein n=1 Tax=Prorocentrum cordatum TaxID=2364126 RepID=A0ABN9Q3Z2_9DINO|nr:unnamed protein product [Polarella glacialis]
MREAEDSEESDPPEDASEGPHVRLRKCLFAFGVIIGFLFPVAIAVAAWNLMETGVAFDSASEATGGQIRAFLVVCLAAPMLIPLGLLSPMTGALVLHTPEAPVGFWKALQRGILKFKVLAGSILVFAITYYFNLLLEWDVLKQFWALQNHCQYFYLKLWALALCSIGSAIVAFWDFPIPMLGARLFLAFIAFFKLLPAVLLAMGLALYVNNPSEEWLEWGLAPFEKLRASSHFVEVFVLALPSMQIEIAALLSGTPIDDRNELLLSSLISLMTATHAFASMDLKGMVFRRVSGIPTVCGTAESISVVFILVYSFRFCNIGSRVLLFPLLHITCMEYHVGTVLFVGDLIAQCWLIWRATQSTPKLLFAVANVFSVTEPLLLSEGSVCTVNVRCWLSVQFVELFLVVVTLCCKPALVVELYESDQLLCLLFVAFSVLQWPLILVIRSRFVHRFDGADAEPVMGAMVNLFSHGYARTRWGPDAADWRSPIGLARNMWWPSLRNKQGTWNGSLQLFGDLGVKVVALLFQNDPHCKELWLEMNSIGDEGAKYIAEALKQNEALEWLDLDQNLITDEGAKELLHALEERPVRLHKLWLRANPIRDERLKVALESLVYELRIGDLDDEEGEDHMGTESDSDSDVEWCLTGETPYSGPVAATYVDA